MPRRFHCSVPSNGRRRRGRVWRWHGVCFARSTNKGRRPHVRLFDPCTHGSGRSTDRCGGGGGVLAHVAAGRPDRRAKGACARRLQTPLPGAARHAPAAALLALDQRARTLVDALLADDVAGNAAVPLARDAVLASGLRALPVVRPGPRPVPAVDARQPAVPAAGANTCLTWCCACFSTARSSCCCGRSSTSGPPGSPGRSCTRPTGSRNRAGCCTHELPVNRRHSPSAVDTTLEREYIHVLLQDLMNGGHFPPHDAFWVSQSIPRWSEALALESHQVRSAEHRFVVDLGRRRRACAVGRANRRARASASIRLRSWRRYATKSRRCAMPPAARARVRRRDADGSSSCCASSTYSARRSGR